MAETPMIIKDLTLGTDPATSYNFPSVDGAASEILTTDGNGNISFAAGGGGGTIGGSITNDQVARGATIANEIEGDNGLLFDGTSLTVNTLSVNNPVVNLSSNTKAAQLEVETNQQLSIKGANSFVFDVSSATGGITFPDGTTQNTAAGGGGGGPSAGSLQSLQCTWPGAVQQWVCVNEANFGWENATFITQSNDLKWSNKGTGGEVEYYPIYFPRDMTIDYTSHISASFSGAGTIDFAIFASDADNFPTGSQLLAWQITIASTTYTHIETSVAATAFTKGLYFLAVDASSSSNYMLGNYAAGFCGLNNTTAAYKPGPAVTPFCNYSRNTDSLTGLSHSDFSYWLAETAATTIPATIIPANLVLGGGARGGQQDEGMIIPALFVRSST